MLIDISNMEVLSMGYENDHTDDREYYDTDIVLESDTTDKYDESSDD